MGKVLACQEVGIDCDVVLKGKDEAEIMSKAAEHANGHHGVQMTPAVQSKP
ncbi:MAG: DUF1059 domain-containing protein [Candidatus Omnitrophica bacterium]|nr:DUF1059 domain-containing protein [Candidatus Omnitrophota bacterium]